MNGRVYDYNLGRFLSVDPFIHLQGDSQGINPYSYIMNNPLAGTDPSGYAIEKEVENIKESTPQLGTRIRRTIGTTTTTKNTDDTTGDLSSISKVTVMNSGSFQGVHIEASNGSANSVTVFGGDNSNGFSNTTDIGAQNQLPNESGGIGNIYQDPRPAPRNFEEKMERMGEDLDHELFKIGDAIGNLLPGATGVPRTMEHLTDVGLRAAEMIRTGHAGIGNILRYEEAWFLYKFAPNGFSLNVDGRVIGSWGSIASPMPLDNTKVHGHISFDKNGRLIKSGLYDFQQILQPHQAWDLKTYSRNRLNRIAIEQHGVGNRFMIHYKYNDSDFQ